MNSNKTLWTIGHSTRDLDDFIDLLKINDIQLLIDVRSFPGSRKFPQFNKENLEISIPESGIQYQLIKKLGGRRGRNKNSHNTAWRNLSFRNYADYMESADFKEGIEELESLALKEKSCYMCSEAVWWRCHRSMISDYLKLRGWEVLHILSATSVQEHPFTGPAKLLEGHLAYGEKGKPLRDDA